MKILKMILKRKWFAWFVFGSLILILDEGAVLDLCAWRGSPHLLTFNFGSWITAIHKMNHEKIKREFLILSPFSGISSWVCEEKVRTCRKIVCAIYVCKESGKYIASLQTGLIFEWTRWVVSSAVEKKPSQIARKFTTKTTAKKKVQFVHPKWAFHNFRLLQRVSASECSAYCSAAHYTQFNTVAAPYSLNQSSQQQQKWMKKAPNIIVVHTLDWQWRLAVQNEYNFFW